MNSDLVYYVAVILLALGVLIICGGGISYGYVSEGRWGQRRGDQEPTRPQKAEGVLVDRTSRDSADRDRDDRRIAA